MNDKELIFPQMMKHAKKVSPISPFRKTDQQPSNHAARCRSALDSIHQNHLGREGLRWNDGKKLRSYDNMPTYPDDPSVLFVWEIASKLFTKEMVSINLLFDCSIIKHFTQFYADISRI